MQLKSGDVVEQGRQTHAELRRKAGQRQLLQSLDAGQPASATRFSRASESGGPRCISRESSLCTTHPRHPGGKEKSQP